MKTFVMTLTEDTLRVISNKCGESTSRTRDDLIARQVAQTIKHVLLPGTPVPMRWADEPLPRVEMEAGGQGVSKVQRMINAFLQYPNYDVGEGEDSTTFLEVINYLADQVPRVLSLKQLRELEGTDHFVWVENNCEPDCFDGYAEVTTNYISKAVELFSFGNEVEWIPSNDCYRKTWRCWSLKPDKDQMENTPWEV